MAIDYQLDAPEAVDVVVEGRGWRQTTPAGRGDRYYQDTAPSCELAEATDAKFTSLTALLGRCHPTDFTGPAKWWIVRGTLDNWPEVDAMVREWRRLDAEAMLTQDPEAITRANDARRSIEKHLTGYADISLNLAADRGSAGHRAIEALLSGQPVDHDDLERHGAGPWLAAIEAFLRDAKPDPMFLEAVAFGRETGTACRSDFMGGLFGRDDLVADWKFRATNHDRRTKEAAQLGGQIAMVRDGYHFDERGRRRQAPVTGCGIVTFCPDGTWAWHEVDVDVALASWRTAVAMRPHTLVSQTYAKARKGEPLDIAAAVAERLDRIPDGTPEYMALGKAWGEHCLDRTNNTWDRPFLVEEWATIDRLLVQHGPFAGPNPAPATYATVEQAADLVRRLAALPEDLLAEVMRAAGGLAPLDSVTLTVDELEDWERLVTPAESAVDARQVDIGIIVDQVPAEMRQAFLVALPELGEVRRWTDADVERAAELLTAIDAGDLILDRHGALIVSARVVEGLSKLDFRMKAKEVAERIGRPVPKKFGDAVGDPVLYAATRAALVSA
jgi:hypothetical protein